MPPFRNRERPHRHLVQRALQRLAGFLEQRVIGVSRDADELADDEGGKKRRGFYYSSKRFLADLDDPAAPQPRRHRDLDGGMATVIGRLAPCPVLGWRFVLLTHNTLRGAAKGAILCAELAVSRGMLDTKTRG